MRKNDIGLLRSLIREMVNEAPYRSSPVVTLRPVQGTGISLGAAALATGIGAISSAYTWLSERCTGQHSNFPIRLSGKAKDKLDESGRRSGNNLVKQSTLWNAYQDTIAEDGVSSKADSSVIINSTNSDRAANYELYGLAAAVLPAWSPPGSAWPDLGQQQRLAVVNKMVPLMVLYTGCGADHIQGLIGNTATDTTGSNVNDLSRLDKFPFASRNDLKQFLIDLLNDSNGSFRNGVIEQRNQLQLLFSAPKDKDAIAKICDAAIEGDESAKNSFLRQIK